MATRTKTHAFPTAGEAWELAENATMRLPGDRSGIRVRVERGTVLVTQAGDEEDHVLEAGDEVVILGAGRLAVAWAFTDAAISVRRMEGGSRTARLPASSSGPGPRAPDGLAAA